jgi:hypothetical protein
LLRQELGNATADLWGRLSTNQDDRAGAAGCHGRHDDQVAQGTLGGRAMTMMMPDHAERRPKHQDDQQDRDYHTPGLRSVSHFRCACKEISCAIEV